MKKEASWVYGLLAVVFLVIASSCSAEKHRIEISVLVDLSGSWHDLKDKTILNNNVTILKEVGVGIADSMTAYQPPHALTYYAIGQQSPGKQPLCRIDYVPRLFTFGRKGEFEVNRLRKVTRLLKENCPEFIVRNVNQKYTDITGAINDQKNLLNEREASSRARFKTKGDIPRVMIILSDFVETRPAASKTNDLQPLNGFHILMVYRAMSKQQGQMKQNFTDIKAWEEKLLAAGAKVTAIDDRHIDSSKIQTFLKERWQIVNPGLESNSSGSGMSTILLWVLIALGVGLIILIIVSVTRRLMEA